MVKSEDNTEQTASAGGQEFMATFMESVRSGIEAFSTLPNDIAAKIDETVNEVESRFESRIQHNRASLFNWTGVPDPDQLEKFKTSIERLESRLDQIETNISTLENHPKGQAWPDKQPRKRKPART